MAGRGPLAVVPVALLGVLTALVLGAAPASGATGAPFSTVPPVATGSAGVGEQLRTDGGSWSTDATLTYRWLRCDAHFANCTGIAGATSAAYVVVAADVGHVLAAGVTATNETGSAVAVSNALGPVAASPPGPRHRPSIKGAHKLGQRVFETGDRWTHSPDTFTVRWLRCSATGNACVRIAGKRVRCASGSCLRVDAGAEWDYKLTRKDLGHRLRVRISASNGAGRATATSNPTRIVTK
ncbi:MAG TPA: hypothetical protein VJV76_04145 [Gaiellaceae bacterium]|nr:hypothetical protein [Gaiellaceae bacterium]